MQIIALYCRPCYIWKTNGLDSCACWLVNFVL